jgi:hypothetical protein
LPEPDHGASSSALKKMNRVVRSNVAPDAEALAVSSENDLGAICSAGFALAVDVLAYPRAKGA